MIGTIKNENDIKKLIVEGGELNKIIYSINNFIDNNGRQGGIKIYKILLKTLDENISDNIENMILDIMDGLSGNCHKESYVGTGNYHIFE